MTDTGQDFEIPDEMTIEQAEAMVSELNNRFSWEFTVNPNYIIVTGRNYYKDAGGRRVREYQPDGPWKLLPVERKAVRIRT